MRKLPVEKAVGETLCHDMTAILADGFKGVRFKRGHVITAEDIPALLDIGKKQVFVWEPEADEVHEDDAALALTQTLCGDNLEFTGPSEGKFQVTASADGLFRVNSAALRQINAVGDFTVATRPGNTAVSAGEKLAGARIVPLVTKRERVERAVALAREHYPVLSVLPYRLKKVAAVITGSEIYTGRIQDRFEPILREKMKKYGAELIRAIVCDDDLDMIKGAVAALIADGAELILLTGGMSVDPDDLTPTAIRESGARVVTQGVPMQPGNMLTVAYLGGVTLLGVPGASMHSPVTSLDVFLPRVMAGVELTARELTATGEGGFCMACKPCTYPICYFGYSVASAD
jgi:molybdenum cofactor synthesis domain-containing protein